MTVASLWKALDRAGCGRAVGVSELKDHHQLRAKTNPWKQGEMEKKRTSGDHCPALAVDLSIWICEALTSSAMKQNQIVDPSLSLVYSRTLKLLNLGIKLVVVVEGKRRIRHSSDDGGSCEDLFRKRRSGAPFWSACQRCEKMLQQMGVTVVRAKAEGEALCALLNQRGVVDGVISKDGDCFLFGAKVLYTRFSIENLEQGRVMRYDVDNIRAFVDDEDGDQYDQTRQVSKEGQEIVRLSRDDLIAFAILTGSDLAGEGVSMVGCRKAIRFIRKCQMDNPLMVTDSSQSISPALELLKSWEKSVLRFARSRTAASGDTVSHGRLCSCCGHPGTKTSHKKNGCHECGTSPGEICLALSPGGRFQKTLRSKVLELKSRFDPLSVANAYHEPNDNQLPLSLIGVTSRTLQMRLPRLLDLLNSPCIIRGRNLTESRAYLSRSLAQYMARVEVFRQLRGCSVKIDSSVIASSTLPRTHERAVPISLAKRRVKNGTTCFEVRWVIHATTTDDLGNPTGEIQFSTIEDEQTIQKCYPRLIMSFTAEERQRKLRMAPEHESRLDYFLKSGFDATREVDRAGAKERRTRKKRSRFSKISLGRPKAQQTEPCGSDDVVNLGLQSRRPPQMELHPNLARVLFRDDDERVHRDNDLVQKFNAIETAKAGLSGDPDLCDCVSDNQSCAHKALTKSRPENECGKKKDLKHKNEYFSNWSSRDNHLPKPSGTQSKLGPSRHFDYQYACPSDYEGRKSSDPLFDHAFFSNGNLTGHQLEYAPRHVELCKEGLPPSSVPHENDFFEGGPLDMEQESAYVDHQVERRCLSSSPAHKKTKYCGDGWYRNPIGENSCDFTADNATYNDLSDNEIEGLSLYYENWHSCDHKETASSGTRNIAFEKEVSADLRSQHPQPICLFETDCTAGAGKEPFALEKLYRMDICRGDGSCFDSSLHYGDETQNGSKRGRAERHRYDECWRPSNPDEQSGDMYWNEPETFESVELGHYMAERCVYGEIANSRNADTVDSWNDNDSRLFNHFEGAQVFDDFDREECMENPLSSSTVASKESIHSKSSQRSRDFVGALLSKYIDTELRRRISLEMKALKGRTLKLVN